MLTQTEILRAVKDPDWQEFRLSLKGLPTSEKLRLLRRLADRTLKDHTGHGKCQVVVDNHIRILNYLNALSRGGQIIALPSQRYDLQALSTVMGSMGKCTTCHRYFLSNTNERRCLKCQPN